MPWSTKFKVLTGSHRCHQHSQGCVCGTHAFWHIHIGINGLPRAASILYRIQSMCFCKQARCFYDSTVPGIPKSIFYSYLVTNPVSSTSVCMQSLPNSHVHALATNYAFLNRARSCTKHVSTDAEPTMAYPYLCLRETIPVQHPTLTLSMFQYHQHRRTASGRLLRGGT